VISRESIEEHLLKRTRSQANIIIEKPLKGYKTRTFDMFAKTALNVYILTRRTILA